MKGKPPNFEHAKAGERLCSKRLDDKLRNLVDAAPEAAVSQARLGLRTLAYCLPVEDHAVRDNDGLKVFTVVLRDAERVDAVHRARVLDL